MRSEGKPDFRNAGPNSLASWFFAEAGIEEIDSQQALLVEILEARKVPDFFLLTTDQLWQDLPIQVRTDDGQALLRIKPLEELIAAPDRGLEYVTKGV